MNYYIQKRPCQPICLPSGQGTGGPKNKMEKSRGI